MTRPEAVDSRPVALVTGVSRRVGIAAAVAEALARAGWRVGMTGWRAYDAEMPWGSDEGELPAVLAAVEAHAPGGVTYIAADLSDASAPSAVFAAVETALGPVEALVNVHTYSTNGGLLEVTAEQFDRHMAVNARGVLLMSAEYARRSIGRGRNAGRIVNFTSGLPLRGEIAYAASKGAIEWITVSAAAELAPHGITVNAVNPGPNDTGWMSTELEQAVAASAPLGRVGTPDDVVGLVVFLCSPDAAWITGQVLDCDGGWRRLR